MTRKAKASEPAADRTGRPSDRNKAAVVLPQEDEARVAQFIDCVAHLMAKRWLREQRDEGDPPSGDATGIQ